MKVKYSTWPFSTRGKSQERFSSRKTAAFLCVGDLVNWFGLTAQIALNLYKKK